MVAKANLEALLMAGVQSSILGRILTAMSVIAVLILAMSIFRTVNEGFEPKFGAIWIVATSVILMTIFHRKLGTTATGVTLYVLFSFLGFFAHLNTGIASIGPIFFFIGLAMAAVTLPTIWLFGLVGAQFALQMVLVALIATDQILPMPQGGLDYLARPQNWIFHSVVVAIGGGLAFYGTSVMASWYRASLAAWRSKFFRSVAIMSLARDQETGEHIDRVSQYASEIYDWLDKTGALPLPFTRDELENAVKLHDIGKISISDQILTKPGKLTEAEFEQVKEHSKLGAKIVKTMMQNSGDTDLTTLSVAHDVALSHHENWDGSGYPQNLIGDAIPVSARIMALCDVYDALRSQRHYKPPWTHEAAVAEILRCKNKFDPRILGLFEAYHDSFRAIFDQSTPASRP
jgi:HD-GYP domain-containing protein (c-di-GMP phosphodiesterase class II)